ncbi:MAG: galactose oxidase [Bacteroidetes bacterium]|nr:galactose oxidase [Bacteroidota bacterium]MBS1931119.1 galactose oxidase [Bacteroidota bacterium]
MTKHFIILLFYFTGLLQSNPISAQKKNNIFFHWEMAAQLPASPGQLYSLGLAGPVAGINKNVLMVAGGSNFPGAMPWLGGKKKYYDDLYAYLIKGGRPVLQKKEYKLPSAIAYTANCSTPVGIVYAGGENERGISKKVFLLKWQQSSSSVIIKNLPDLPVPVTNASATSDGNIVYVAGGETTTGVSDLFFSLDLKKTKAGWRKLPSLPQPTSHAVMVVQLNGKNSSVYLIGGRKKNKTGVSDLYSSVFRFDIKKNQWEQRQSLPYALSAGTGISTADQGIFIFGGDRGETFHKTEELIASINNETDSAKKELLNTQKIQLQSTHPGFSHDVLLYNTEKNEWKIVDEIPFDSPVTTTTVKYKNDVFIPGGEIRAGVRTPQILLGILK